MLAIWRQGDNDEVMHVTARFEDAGAKRAGGKFQGIEEAAEIELAGPTMQSSCRQVIAEIDKRPPYDPSGAVGDKPKPAVFVKERQTIPPRIFIDTTLASACEFSLTYEPLNLERLEAEVSADYARIDLNDALLNFNLVHDIDQLRVRPVAFRVP